MPDTPSNLPYKQAKLVIPSPESKKQDWVVVAWIYDIAKGKKVRKQITYFNNPKEYPTEDLKRLEAEKVVSKVNARLAKGGYIDSRKNKFTSPQQIIFTEKVKHNLIEEINTVLFSKRRLRENSIYSYEKYLGVFIPFIKKHGPVYYEDYTAKDWDRFAQYLETRAIKSNRTFNNYLNALSTLFEGIDKGLNITINPLKGIERLPMDEGRNTAFTEKQVVELLNFMKTNCPEMLLPCKMLFYTFIRPGELRKLKLWRIGLYQPTQIYLGAKDSKSRNNRYATMPQDLIDELDKIRIKNYHNEFYLFGNTKYMTPGPNMVSETSIAKKFRQRVLNKLGYGVEYTFYSWKHTGVIWAKLKGNIPDASIIMQGGWKDWHSFTKYLKSLGLMDNSDFANKMPNLSDF